MYTNINMRCSQIKAFRNRFNVVNSYWEPLTEDISYIDHIEFVKRSAGFMLSNIGFDGGKKKYFADWMQSHDLDLATQSFDVCRSNYDMAINRLPSFNQATPIEIREHTSGSIIDQNYLSVYVQDELGFFKNKVRLMLAGRYTSVVKFDSIISNNKAKKITPRLGLSISPDKNSAVYALYDQGFVPQSGLFCDGSVKGFCINAGVTYLGNRTTDTWSKGLEKFPNYAKFDANLSYQKNKIRITGNVFNLLIKYIYSDSYYQPLQTYYWQAETPRNFKLNVAYKF